MAFWGVEVEPGKPFTLKPATEATGIRRLHLSQATLGRYIGNGTNILVCNVGSRRPLFLCILSAEKVDSCQLNLEFEEADEVIFSVIGSRSIHITGYFLGTPTASRLNDDETLARADDVEVCNNDKDDHKIPKVLSWDFPLPSSITKSKERTYTSEKGVPNDNNMQVFGSKDRSDDPLPVFYRRLYKLVDDPSSDSTISWSESNKGFVIRNQEKLIRRKIYMRFFYCSTFERFIFWLKHYGFNKIKRSDGLLEFGNKNFVRGQPDLMKEMYTKAMLKGFYEDFDYGAKAEIEDHLQNV